MTVFVSEKLPARSDAGGSVFRPVVPVDTSPSASCTVPSFTRRISLSRLKKKNNRLRTMGPPIVPPKMFLVSWPLSAPAGRKYGRFFSPEAVRYSNSEPLIVFVPLFTCTLTAAPPAIP